jgi:hypothetical protein
VQIVLTRPTPRISNDVISSTGTTGIPKFFYKFFRSASRVKVTFLFVEGEQ